MRPPPRLLPLLLRRRAGSLCRKRVRVLYTRRRQLCLRPRPQPAQAPSSAASRSLTAGPPVDQAASDRERRPRDLMFPEAALVPSTPPALPLVPIPGRALRVHPVPVQVSVNVQALAVNVRALAVRAPVRAVLRLRPSRPVLSALHRAADVADPSSIPRPRKVR